MGKYDNQLESLFNDWIKASKKDEYRERRDINNNIIFTYDGLMYKPDLLIDVEDDWEKENKRIMFLFNNRDDRLRLLPLTNYYEFSSKVLPLILRHQSMGGLFLIGWHILRFSTANIRKYDVISN